jgi:hypothetical protein
MFCGAEKLIDSVRLIAMDWVFSIAFRVAISRLPP